MLVRIALALLLPVSAQSVAVTPPTLIADYEGSLTSSVVGAPALSIVGSGTAFSSEQVLYYLPAQNVLVFTAGSGVELNLISQILPSPYVYTIALQARITNTSPDGFSKLIDFTNGTADSGLYDQDGALRFYYYASSPTKQIGADYGDIVVTRDAAGALRGYYNGAPQFSIDDSANPIGVIDASDKLRFFLDDSVGAGTEQSTGAVARIRIWDNALGATAVAQLTDPIFANGFGPM